MASENMGVIPNRKMENGLNAAKLLFHNETRNAHTLQVGCCGGGGSGPSHHRGTRGDAGGPRTRELSGFLDEKLINSVHRDQYLTSQGAAAVAKAGEFRRSMYAGEVKEGRGEMGGWNWNGNGAMSTDSDGDESEDEDEEDDDNDADDVADVDEGDRDLGNLVRNSIDGTSGSGKNSNYGGSTAIGDKIVSGHSKDRPSLGQPGAGVNRANTSDDNQQRRMGHFPNEVTVAETDGDTYYSQFMQGSEGTSHGQKDVVCDNGCAFSGLKDGPTSSDPGDLLTAIFSDPIRGTLMDDAMILPCGHSFGGGGIQQVIRMKACYTCAQPVTQDLVSPNLSLRAAVQAFRRKEEQMYRAFKRRRERFDQDKPNCSDSAFTDPQRGRGVKFPFVVTDRVIIKGNKRTPERFVGREAVVTTQCLNGWYVVKTLDNAESVKLQYRSLAKVSDNSSLKPFSDRDEPELLIEAL